MSRKMFCVVCKKPFVAPTDDGRVWCCGGGVKANIAGMVVEKLHDHAPREMQQYVENTRG